MSIVQSSMEQAQTVALTMPAALSEVTVQFEHPLIAAGGLAVAGASTWMGIHAGRMFDALGEKEARSDLYPDPDQRTYVEKQYHRQGRIMKAAGLAIGLAAGAHLANVAGPHTTETEYHAHNVAIIVDASADGRATDVTDSTTNRQIARMQAGINSGFRFANDAGEQVDVQFIFAGSTARSLGDVKDSDGKADVIASADSYSKDLTTADSTDMKGALALAETHKPEQTIVITSNSSVTTAEALNSYKGDLTVLAPGKEGTTYEFLGSPHTVSYTTSFGEKKATVAQTTGQMQDAMSHIIDTSVKSEKDVPSSFYENLRNLSILGLAAGATAAVAAKYASLKRRKQ